LFRELDKQLSRNTTVEVWNVLHDLFDEFTQEDNDPTRVMDVSLDVVILNDNCAVQNVDLVQWEMDPD